MTAFDPAQYKETTRDQWQQTAEAWHRWGPTLKSWLGPATDVMLDLAHVGPKSRVLDVAAGAGEPAITIAERVGPSGYVLATDIAPNILEFAARSARERGIGNLETRVMDGENLELPDESFDVVTSRVGLIYFPNQQRALSGMRRVLKPGGRVAAIVYTTPEKAASSPFPSRSSDGTLNFRRRCPVNPARSALARLGAWRRRIGGRVSTTLRRASCRRRCEWPRGKNMCASLGSRSVRCTRCWLACPKRSARPRGMRSSGSSANSMALGDLKVHAS